MLKVDFGGTSKGGEWITVNIDNGVAHNAPDILADITAQANQLSRHFAAHSIEAARCIATLEHLYPHDHLETLIYWRGLMASGATLLVLVPDTRRILADFAAGLYEMETLAGILYGPADWQKKTPGESHHWGFDECSLRTLLERAGFHDVRRAEWEGSWSVNGACVHNLVLEATA